MSKDKVDVFEMYNDTPEIPQEEAENVVLNAEKDNIDDNSEDNPIELLGTTSVEHESFWDNSYEPVQDNTIAVMDFSELPKSGDSSKEAPVAPVKKAKRNIKPEEEVILAPKQEVPAEPVVAKETASKKISFVRRPQNEEVAPVENLKPEVEPEVKPEVTPEVEPEVAPEVEPEVTPKVETEVPEAEEVVEEASSEPITEKEIVKEEPEIKPESVEPVKPVVVEKPTETEEIPKKEKAPKKSILKTREKSKAEPSVNKEKENKPEVKAEPVENEEENPFYKNHSGMGFSGGTAPQLAYGGTVLINYKPEKDRKPHIRKKRRKKSKKNTIISWVLTIFAACIVAMLINIFVIRPSRVSGPSMEPTLQDGDTVLLSRLPYTFKSPSRGDIIVIDSNVPDLEKDKRNELKLFEEAIKYNVITNFLGVSQPDYFWIKRVIAVPGDEIEFRDGKVYRNGVELKEKYIKEKKVTNYPDGVKYEVPAGYVFVMGDNRNNSTDSRNIGIIPVDNIIGKMVFPDSKE